MTYKLLCYLIGSLSGRILLVPNLLFSVGCLLFVVGFKILFFLVLSSKLVGSEGLPNLLLELKELLTLQGSSF